MPAYRIPLLLERLHYSITSSLQAGKLFLLDRPSGVLLRTEGVLPAPESSHAVAMAIQEALEAKERKGENESSSST